MTIFSREEVLSLLEQELRIPEPQRVLLHALVLHTVHEETLGRIGKMLTSLQARTSILLEEKRKQMNAAVAEVKKEMLSTEETHLSSFEQQDLAQLLSQL